MVELSQDVKGQKKGFIGTTFLKESAKKGAHFITFLKESASSNSQPNSPNQPPCHDGVFVFTSFFLFLFFFGCGTFGEERNTFS